MPIALLVLVALVLMVMGLFSPDPDTRAKFFVAAGVPLIVFLLILLVVIAIVPVENL